MYTAVCTLTLAGSVVPKACIDHQILINFKDVVLLSSLWKIRNFVWNCMFTAIYVLTLTGSEFRELA